ncbi:MAG: FAD-dependent oxidoreductase [Bacilli bacterium]|nr:FAD-dependent oxidoreductase [Bacilli bacterium]
MKKEIIVIGGSAAGLVAATTAKSNHPDKSVLLIRKEETVLIPCGIPYIFGTLASSDEDILPDGGLINAGVEIMVGTVDLVNPEEHTVTLENGDTFTYEKLIMATGSTPFVPDFIEGTDLENVFVIPKNKTYLDIAKKHLDNAKNIAVIGAGFIGVELSDELAKAGKNVTLIEAQEDILCCAFDTESCKIAESILVERGVKVMTSTYVKKLVGPKTVKQIQFASGDTLDVDAVILSIGYRANVELAKKSGISVNKQGAIKVDAYMRTHQQDIFACGDCAQKRDFVTGKIINVMLASTACAEARVAGMNLYELSTIKKFNGTIGIYSTNIGKTSFGVAGITEKRAAAEGFNIVSATFKGMDRHPGKLNQPHYQSVKLVVNKTTGIIMGGEVIGGNSIGELTNVLGFIIQNNMTVTDVLVSQIGTQPMLTASPAKYPLIEAAEMVSRKMRK